MKAEVTCDELRSYGLRVLQPEKGYRFSLDPLLLCDFARVPDSGNVIDLGTGCGIIPLVLARRSAAATVVGVELQESMADLARRSVTLNGLDGRIDILCADILTLRGRFPVSTFDLVVANPPYRKQGTGRVSPRAGRDVARHETTATLADFLGTAKYLVTPGGTISFIYHPSRLAEFCETALGLNLAPLRLQMIHGRRHASARMMLLELSKGRRGDLEVLPPVYVHGEGDDRCADDETPDGCRPEP